MSYHFKNNLRYPNYLTIWDIAHRSAGYFPELTDEKNPPDDLIDSLKHYTELASNSLPFYKHEHLNEAWMNSTDTGDFSIKGELFFLWRKNISKQLEKMSKKGIFKRKLLDTIYIPRMNIGHFCLNHNYPLPECWFDPDEIQAIDDTKRIWFPDPVFNSDSDQNTFNRFTNAKIAAKAKQQLPQQVKERFREYYKEQCEAGESKLKIASVARKFKRLLSDNEYIAICPSRKTEGFIRTLQRYLRETDT